MFHFSPIKTPKTLQYSEAFRCSKMQHCLKLELMIDFDVQGTSKITMICRMGSRGRSNFSTVHHILD